MWVSGYLIRIGRGTVLQLSSLSGATYQHYLIPSLCWELDHYSDQCSQCCATSPDCWAGWETRYKLSYPWAGSMYICTLYKIWYHFSSTLNRGVRCSGHIYVSALLSTPSKQFWDLKEEGTIFIIPGSNLSDVILPGPGVGAAWRDLAEGQCARN